MKLKLITILLCSVSMYASDGRKAKRPRLSNYFKSICTIINRQSLHIVPVVDFIPISDQEEQNLIEDNNQRLSDEDILHLKATLDYAQNQRDNERIEAFNKTVALWNRTQQVQAEFTENARKYGGK